MPRACPVEPHGIGYTPAQNSHLDFGAGLWVAAIVKLNGASPWHLLTALARS